MLKRAIKVLTNKPTKIKGPVFTKDFSSDEKQIKDLEKLLTICNINAKSFIQNDIKKLKYGAVGENNIYYELKNSFVPMMCMHNLRIEYKGMVAQIDFVAITSKYIYIIECKNLIGDITITDKGEFIRYKKNSYGKVTSKEGMYSPIVQNERHINIIKELLKDKLEYKYKLKRIESLIVTANPKTVINKKYASKEISNKIIRHDQLIDTINESQKNKKIDWVFIEDDMINISNCLMKYHKEIKIDYKSKYGIDTELQIDKSVDTENINSIDVDDRLRENLRRYRLITSKDEELKPFMVFSNETMEELIKYKPQNIEELKNIKGFGTIKCEKYGNGILGIISEMK
jgi:hypothetical protein